MGYGVDDAPQFVLVLPQLLFSSLEVFDIGIRSVPPDDVAPVIEQRLDPNHEPTILAVVAPLSQLVLTRLPGRKDLMLPIGSNARGIVGMNHESPNVALRCPSEGAAVTTRHGMHERAQPRATARHGDPTTVDRWRCRR